MLYTNVIDKKWHCIVRHHIIVHRTELYRAGLDYRALQFIVYHHAVLEKISQDNYSLQFVVNNSIHIDVK